MVHSFLTLVGSAAIVRSGVTSRTSTSMEFTFALGSVSVGEEDVVAFDEDDDTDC